MSLSYSEPPFPGERFLRWAEVRARSSLGEMTIRRHMTKGSFPPMVKITDKSVGWNSLDFDAWMGGCRKFPRDETQEEPRQASESPKLPTATVLQICPTKRKRGRPRKVRP